MVLKGEVRVEEVGVQEGDGDEEEHGNEEHGSGQHTQTLGTAREDSLTCITRYEECYNTPYSVSSLHTIDGTWCGVHYLKLSSHSILAGLVEVFSEQARLNKTIAHSA